MGKKVLIISLIACFFFNVISCDLFSLEEWFDFPTKAVITTNDISDIHIGETVSLDGSTSECGMNETLIYTWEIAEKPLGSIATLDHPTSKTSSFTPDYAGTYIISLTVVDDDEDSNSCNYSIDVSAIITTSAGTGGSITPSGAVSVTQGSDKTFTITPETGYEISDVFVDGESVGAVTSHTFSDVTENHTISASFLLVEYVITASAGTGGSINPSGDVSVTHGSDKTFTITSETGYEVSDVLVDGKSVGAVTSHTFDDVTENHTISVTFSLVDYVITASAGTGGSINPSGDVSVTHGDDQTFTITPETGYEIADVFVDGESVGAVTSHTFNDVTENHTISATFSLVDYVITASAGTGGSINPSGDVSVTHGDDKTFTITPETGYEVSDVLVDEVSVGAVTSYTFYDVTENHTISVSFVLGEYTITFYKNATDAIGVMPPEDVINGETIVLPIVGFSRAGYTFSGWSTSSGGEVEFTDQSSFTVGSSNVTLFAIWEGNTYIITFDKNDESAIGTMPDQNVKSGIVVNLNANVYEKVGSIFTGWATNPSGPVVYEDQASFMIGISNVTLYAQWEEVKNLLPTNGTTTIDTTPTFSWSEINYSTGYHFQLVKDEALFDSSDYIPVTSNSYVPEEVLDNLSTYYWRLRVANNEKLGSWTEANSFSIDFGDVNNLLPVSGSGTSDTTPLFSWDEVPGAINYEFQISESEPDLDTATKENCVSNEYEPSNALENTKTYYWRVRARNNDGVYGEWSGNNSISINWLGEITDKVPVDGSVTIDQTPRLSWDVNDSATSYELQFSEVGFDLNDSEIRIIDNKYFYLEDELIIGEEYQWRVRAKDSGGSYGSWSEINKFTVKSSFSIRDTRTKGSIIFYDKGSYSDGWRYLEVAPYGWYNGGNDPLYDWGVWSYTVSPSATARGIGYGSINTTNIVLFHDRLGTEGYLGYAEGWGSYYENPSAYNTWSNGQVAAKLCVEAEIVGYTDWFLPSADELKQIYNILYLSGIGNFMANGTPYWSSSEYDSKEAMRLGFNPYYYKDLSKSSSCYIRPVRSF